MLHLAFASAFMVASGLGKNGSIPIQELTLSLGCSAFVSLMGKKWINTYSGTDTLFANSSTNHLIRGKNGSIPIQELTQDTGRINHNSLRHFSRKTRINTYSGLCSSLEIADFGGGWEGAIRSIPIQGTKMIYK